MEGRSVWYVLHVKPRTEKKCVEYLLRYNCWHHLPTFVKERKVQRRKVRTVLPLFQGYVFTRLNAEKRSKILRSNLIVRFIEMTRPRETIRQLRWIRKAGRLGPVVPTETYVSNDYVRVKSGPFYGLYGYVKDVANHGRMLVINIDMLGRAVAVNIDAAECEKADAS